MAPPLTWQQQNPGDNRSYDARNNSSIKRYTLPPTPPAPSIADTMRDDISLFERFKKWQADSQGSSGSGNTKVVDEGFGWNKGSADMISAGLGGLGNLASGWAAIKGLGIAQDELDENKRQYNQNYGQQLKAYNAQVGMQNNRTNEVNAWKTAQGRTDMRDLIPVG